MKLATLPKIDAFKDGLGGVYQVVKALYKHMPTLGWEITAPEAADIIHCLCTDSHKYVDVYTNVGWLYGKTPWEMEARIGMKYNLDHAAVVTAPSIYMADLLMGIRDREIRVIPNGVDCAEWSPVSPLPYILWGKVGAEFGRNRDACMLALEVAQMLPKRQFVFTVVPQGVSPPANVKMLGLMPHDRWAEWMRSATVYLATGLEPGAVAVVEALAAGVPVASIDEGATQEYIAWDCGLVGHTAREIAECVEELWRERKKYGKRAYEQAQQFDWAKIMPDYVNAYKAAIGD